MERWRQHAGAGIALWIVFTGIEIIFVGKIDPQETPVGFGVAGLTAALTVAALAACGTGYRLRWSWLLVAPRVAWNVVHDSVVLTVVLLRALSGRGPDDGIVEVPFDAGGDDAESRARRALVIAAVSTAPNSIVLGVDDARGTLRMHYLSRSAAKDRESERWPV
jgi:multisubunit Na+/H+ antiporter MnhE subunit